MKIKRETNLEFSNRISMWHKWFAWHPVLYDGGMAWLETIERRFNFETNFASNGTWYYRPLNKVERSNLSSGLRYIELKALDKNGHNMGPFYFRTPSR